MTVPIFSLLSNIFSIDNISFFFRGVNNWIESPIPKYSSAFKTQVVLPIPEGPSTTKHLPLVLKVTTILIYSLGSTKVYVGTPESLNTSCKKAM